jgi:5'-AMP-activated protein kinase catalytic alpha subunit
MVLQLYQVDFKSYLLDFKSLPPLKITGDDSNASNGRDSPPPNDYSGSPTQAEFNALLASPAVPSPCPSPSGDAMVETQGHHTMEFFEMCAALITQLAR